MSTQKPELLPYVWANVVDNYNPSDPEYGEIIEKPDPTKIETGWVFGEKPSHKYFNWGWRELDGYIHHLNEFGIPTWDPETEYKMGSVVLDRPYIYRALTDNQNVYPTDPASTGDWELIGQTLENLDDVTFPIATDKPQILVYNDSTSQFENKDLGIGGDVGIIDEIGVENLRDTQISIPATPDQVLTQNSDGVWQNVYASDACKEDESTQFNLVKDVQFDYPEEGDVIRWTGTATSGIWKMVKNTNASTTWSKVLNPPNTFAPPYATDRVLGGAKMFNEGTTLNIYTIPNAAPGAPEKVDTISNPVKVKLFWLPGTTGDRSYYYNIYRNELKYDTGILDVVYNDTGVERDREYTYYVTGVNQHGESGPSNRVIGHTFSEPSAPRNLTYQLSLRNVTLNWELPETTSGSMEYQIYRDNTLIDVTPELFYTDYDVPVGVYDYYVVAKNKYYYSNNSNTVTIVIQ